MCIQSLNEGKQTWPLVFVILVFWHSCSLCNLKLIALTWYFLQLRFISLGDSFAAKPILIVSPVVVVLLIIIN